MPDNHYYHYDHETCSFVEVKPNRTRFYMQLSMVAVGAVLLTALIALGLDRVMESPQELSLQQENEALQQQLDLTGQRIEDFATELQHLSATDQTLYRLLLQADPISEDVRRVGVGGSDPYEPFNRFRSSAAELLKKTTQQLDQLERQFSLQNTSYRELTKLARDHEQWLKQLPAIMPATGRVTSFFGMRNHPILKIRKLHPGVDIPVHRGTPVYATGDGIVEKTGYTSGYGIRILIRHPIAGYKTLYAHLSKISPHVRLGRWVKRGEQIALSGNTGLSAAPHVHYEVQDLEGRKLNPIRFFAPSMTPQQYKVLLAESEKSTVSLD